MTENLNIHAHGRTGHLSLNRPKALHALTLDMCHAMSAALAGWAGDDGIEAVILDHAEGRGFCAGGDINLLRHSALNDGGKSGREFFHDEYRLNHQMFEYAKPIVAFMDGITMGGGVGIALPCKYRVATENTRFAMPESGIGLFPDVGGGWHLSRLGGRLDALAALVTAAAEAAGKAKHVYVLKFFGDVTASQVAQLRQEVTAVLRSEAVELLLGHVLYEGIVEFIQQVDVLGNVVNSLPVIGPIRVQIMTAARDQLDLLVGKQIASFLGE